MTRTLLHKRRVMAGLIHLSISAAMGFSIVGLVFCVWYPWPYSELSGGLFLVSLVISVDIVAGPLLTFVVFNPQKPQRELRHDVSLIVCLQSIALGYGLWSVWIARPVQLVYEYERFGIVRAAEVDPALMGLLHSSIDPVPNTGPGLVSLRPFKDSSEQAQATLLAISGVPLASRVDLWQPYENAVEDILASSRPVTELLVSHPDQSEGIRHAAAKAGLKEADMRFLPLMADHRIWTVLIENRSARPVGFLPFDPI